MAKLKKQRILDDGHKQTDKMLKALENKITKEYYKAGKYVSEKFKKYLDQFNEADKKKLNDLKNNIITQSEYSQWRANQILNTRRFKDMLDVLAEDMTNADKIATGIINNHTIDVYALNRNYGSYEICKATRLDLSFSLYDHKTVERLMRKNPEVIPRAKPDIPKELRWCRTKLNSAITQGVLTGDSIPDIAKRLQSVTDMLNSAAIRNARTWTTAAENGGRVDSYKEAAEMGIELEQEWMATVDDRTRPSHVDLDGEKVSVGEKFSNGCRYPGDPSGDPEEIYNCRCTLVAVLAKHPRDESDRFMRLPDGMSYDDWKREKGSGDDSD